MKNVTIEQLAEKLNQTVWVKGDLKRIYLNDAGHNTKKMSTKVYIYEKNGEFRVSVTINCPSQHDNWIEAQENELRDRIELDIEDAVERILDPSIEQREKEEEAKLLAEWEAGKEERDRKALELAKEEEAKKKIEAEKTAKVFQSGGKKYSHSKLGIGIVTGEDDQTITIVFEGVGEKKLLKRFAALTKVE